MSKIKRLINQHVRADDKTLLTLVASIVPFIFAYWYANLTGAQYVGAMGLVTPSWLIMAIPMGLLFAISIYARTLTPRISFVTWTYSLYFFIVLVTASLTDMVQLTPFHPIDFTLVKIDQALGFSQTAWLNWTYAHPFIGNLVNTCYGLMSIQLIVVPLVLALMMQKRAIRVLFISLLISFVIGTTIYYFLPTMAPASMFYDPHFALQQHDTFIKFYEIHHYLTVTTSEGGLIAFPSFHVVWAVLLAYAFRHKKYLFGPMIVFNAIIILSTIMLGWHYLTDVISGVALAAISIGAAEWAHKKYIASERVIVTSAKHNEVNNPYQAKLI